MRKLLLAGTSLLALSASIASASAAPTAVTFDYTGGLQTYPVPSNGAYEIVAIGGQGGTTPFYSGRSDATGGYGAKVQGIFNLTQSNVLNILVGGQGGNGSNYSPSGTGASGGGGGSFVVKAGGGPLVVAGGGGGGGSNAGADGANAVRLVPGEATNYTYVATSGGGARGGSAGSGGSGGSGASAGPNPASQYTSNGGGGGGYKTSGTGGSGGGVNSQPGGGGMSFSSGGAGGQGFASGGGGFGGGGAGGGKAAFVPGGGGGGGYSGGGGGWSDPGYTSAGKPDGIYGMGFGGGAGGSLSRGAYYAYYSATGGGNGSVMISYVGSYVCYDQDTCAVRRSTVRPVPEPASAVLFGTGLAGLGLIRRRRRV